MIKVQGKDLSECLSDIQLKLVRTYKGDITRTQTGLVAAFPTSFVTPGFSLTFIGDRALMKRIEQIFLSSDLVELTLDYGGTSLKGAFSCTTNECTELRDKGERSMQLSIEVVSDGTDITDASGNAFTVKAGSSTVLSGCAFGKVYTVPSGYTNYKLDGFKLPGGKILVLGNHNLTS